MNKKGDLRVVAQPYLHGPNDIWALSLILLNMIIGGDPWKFAVSSIDARYRLFLHQPHFFRYIYPISGEANDLIRKMLHPEIKMRPSLKDIRREVGNIKTFFLSDKELLKVPARAREKAFHLHLRQAQFQLKPPALPPSLAKITAEADRASKLRRIRSLFDLDNFSRRNKTPPAIVVDATPTRAQFIVRPQEASAMSSRSLLPAPPPLARDNEEGSSSSTSKPSRTRSALLGLPTLVVPIISKVSAMSAESFSPGASPVARAESQMKNAGGRSSSVFKFKTWGAGRGSMAEEKDKTGLGNRKLSRIFLPVAKGESAR